MKNTQTAQRTYNNQVKKQVIELMPTAKRSVKKHVPGCGYVFYIKDAVNNTIGFVSKETKGMQITVK